MAIQLNPFSTIRRTMPDCLPLSSRRMLRGRLPRKRSRRKMIGPWQSYRRWWTIVPPLAADANTFWLISVRKLTQRQSAKELVIFASILKRQKGPSKAHRSLVMLPRWSSEAPALSKSHRSGMASGPNRTAIVTMNTAVILMQILTVNLPLGDPTFP